MNISKLFVSALALATVSVASAEDNPIQVAMKYAHKAPQGEKKICEKLVSGTATDEEITKTLELYKAMVDAKPPKGEPAAFKEKVVKLIAATEDVAAKKPGANDAYKTAVGCKACHSEHKEDKK